MKKCTFLVILFKLIIIKIITERIFFAKYEVLAVAFIKIPVDWDFMPCELATRYELLRTLVTASLM